jgi:hypothetical protein
MLEKMTDKQLREWYYATIKKRAIKDGIQSDPDFHGKQSRTRHDLWSMYQIGDSIKVVYFKALPPEKKERPLFSDLPPKPKFEKHKRSEADRFASSISRARNRIFELAMCNEFTFFCTFTQDKKKRDRFDLSEFRKDFAMLVRNMNRTRPEDKKIKYLLIPEQHKNGAWHMHGLLAGLEESDLRKFELSERLPKAIRNQLEKGEAVFDWTRYRKAFGYFTCTEIKEKNACSKYITKYVTKDLESSPRKNGEHLFFASQGLKGKETLVRLSDEPCALTEWDFENQYIKVAEFPADGGLSRILDSENIDP